MRTDSLESKMIWSSWTPSQLTLLPYWLTAFDTTTLPGILRHSHAIGAQKRLREIKKNVWEIPENKKIPEMQNFSIMSICESTENKNGTKVDISFCCCSCCCCAVYKLFAQNIRFVINLFIYLCIWYRTRDLCMCMCVWVSAYVCLGCTVHGIW